MQPLHLPSWIEQNKDKLKPPVNNFLVHNGEFIVMVIGGPNRRTDFHVNPTEVLWRNLYERNGFISIKEVLLFLS